MRMIVLTLLASLVIQTARAAEKPINPARVTRETVDAAIRQAVAIPRPRLFVPRAGFDALRHDVAQLAFGPAALDRLRFEADQMLAFPVSARVLEGRRLLDVSRTVLHRVSALALAYRLTGHAPYLDRAAAEMRAVSAFSDWNPSHFLDVAEMTLAMAVGYDWLYQHLDPETRRVVADAILEKGLRASLKHAGWVRASNNWGQVCHAGMLAGAFALLEDHPDLAAEIAHRAIVNLPRSMNAYAPKGHYPEGPGYWSYGTGFNVLALSMLEDLLGSDFGLSSLPGFLQTADYLDLVTGPSGLTFNYADNGMNRSTDFATWWFARRLNRPDLLAYFEYEAFQRYCANRRPLSPERSGSRLFPFTFFWLMPMPANLRPASPLNWSSDCKTPIAIHRSSWNHDRATFVGLKAGSPSAPHGHMDAGSFVFDADGIRWAHDLGIEGYHKIEARGMNLWSAAQDSDRWRIFRLNTLSHNTLVIDGQHQLAKGSARIAAFSDGPEPFTVLDLSPVYTNASRVTRTGALLANGMFRLTDRIEGARPGALVRWGMLTRATPDTPQDRALLLNQAGQRLRLLAQHDPIPVWRTFETAKPPNAWDSPNPGTVMVGFEAEIPASGVLDFSVLFTPGSALP